ncbi:MULTISPECIES: hypothetical protein [unclassified Deinococcus]|uniref:hypothetical protein n=1 Tax=unclassified Deinococcus TaxID=2623546 RepID=UPI001C30624F|nr:MULTISPECIES: hypothetical protein [unclassified Deinococcus]MDK2014376.1 hypothetical protein [Deinococcus sp. 43]
MRSVPGGSVTSVQACEAYKKLNTTLKNPSCFEFNGFGAENIMSATMLLALSERYMFFAANSEGADSLMPAIQTMAWYKTSIKTKVALLFVYGGVLDGKVIVIVEESPL